YINQFRSIVNQITDMADADKIYFFIRGLLPNTKREVIRSQPTTFQNAITAAIASDMNYQSYVNINEPRHKPQPRRQNSNFRAQSRAPTQRHASSAVPMELDNISKGKSGKMTADERQRLMKEGKCFVCKQKGHRSRDCPNRNQSS
ncbi:hypothetical protein BKA69DRAFT_1023706, partial [Paraphysoderma sedebokerense]